MLYGAMNLPLRSVAKEIRDIGKLGFDYIELTIDAPEATPRKIKEQKKVILEELKRSGMSIMGHLPTFISTADLYESIRTASLKEIIDALEAGRELGMKKFVFHPGRIGGMGRYVKDVARACYLDVLSKVMERARKLELTICIENMFPDINAFIEAKEFKEVFKQYPDIKLTLDVAHANLGAKKNRTSEFVKAFGDRIGHLHVSDNFGREDNHLPLGTGAINFPRIIKELKKTTYNDTLTLEVFSRDKDYLKLSLVKIKKLWDKYPEKPL
ncbi:MAG: sugar phosphate isomerase/epimerase [Proteobacteria bacterium]|nr:sugar phosphate isomerase/epimerase [Pseudomonadota bacterium]